MENGAPRRVHLERAAANGRQQALEALEGPEIPDAVAYLYDWALELHGRSGIGMEGVSPLSYVTVVTWAQLTGRDPQPDEVEALMLLDAVLRNPDAGED